jgi:hypothetical protein
MDREEKWPPNIRYKAFVLSADRCLCFSDPENEPQKHFSTTC